MKDIIITMPKDVVESVLSDPWEKYFFKHCGRGRPRYHQEQDRVFFVWGGYIRGFCKTHEMRQLDHLVSLDGRHFGKGWYLKMYPESWRWIHFRARRGFQGFRYTDMDPIIKGTWESDWNAMNYPDASIRSF